MKTIGKTLLALTLAGIAQSSLAAVTVGSEASCNFHTINDAINSVPVGGTVSIRLSNNMISDPFLSIDRNVTLVGGYSNCSDTTSDANAPSVIQGIGNNQPVAHVSGFANPLAVNVSLTSLVIRDGAAPRGAGVRIGGAASVRLSSVEVTDNVAEEFGGGIYIDGSKGAQLTIQYATQVTDNVAIQRGGGIFCINANSETGGKIDFRDGDIADNVAGAHGGGVYLEICDMTGSSSGERRIASNQVDRVEFPEAIVDEYSAASGAGIYATSASHITLGSRSSTTVIEGNVGRNVVHDGFGTHYEVDRGEGSGLTLLNESVAKLTNAHIANNQANDGGGVMLRGGARFELKRDPGGCIPNANFPGCASLTGNRGRGYDTGFDFCISVDQNYAGRGGAIAMRESSAELDGVWVKSNSVNQTDGCINSNYYAYPHGAAFDMRAGSRLDIINTVLHDNGNNTADDIIHLDGSQTVFLAFHSTIVGNSNVDDAIMRTSSGAPAIGLFNTVMMESAKLYENDGAADALLRSACVFSNSLSTLDDAPSSSLIESLQGSDARFVDAATDNFLLLDDSPAIDLCIADEVTSRGKLDAVLYDHDGLIRPRIAGTDVNRSWDAGAFENQNGLSGVVADLSIDLDDGGFVVGLNQSMGYIVTLANNGPDAVSNAGFRLVLDSDLQNPMTLVPFGAGWSCSHTGYIGNCVYTEVLPSGASAPQVIAQFTSPSGPGVISSTVNLLTPALLVDADTSNNSDSVVSSISVDSDLMPSLSQIPASLQPGQTARFNATLTNNGPDASLGPRLRVTYPESVANVSVVESPGTAWVCGPLFPDGQGYVSMVCAAQQALVGDFEFTFEFQVPGSQAVPSVWPIRVRTQQDQADPVTPNDIQVNIPVVPSVENDRIFGDGFGD
ncbi:hypothetical protein [Dokdonella sp.]|uniref:hypothetical protein n=1 Tax=Dokdonella sp. TaxID=2291710 RepID=UPI003527230C